MFRPWKTTLREAGSQTSRRRKHRFVPSLSGSLSQLEDRVVLSGAGHAAEMAQKAHTLAMARHQPRAVATTTAVVVSVTPTGSSTLITTFSKTFTTPARTPVTPSMVRRLATLANQDF